MRSKTLLFALFAGLVLSGAAYAENSGSVQAKTEFTEVPPDTPEFFLDRYRYFIPKKDRKPIEELFKPIKKIDDAYKDELKKLDKQLQKAEDQVRKENKRLAEQKGSETRLVALTAELTDVSARRQELLAKRDAEKLPFRSQLEPLIVQFWASRDPDPATPENEFKQEIDERIQDIAEERFFTGVDTTGLMFRSNGGFFGDMARVYLLYGLPQATGIIEEGTYLSELMLWLYMDEEGNPLFAFLFYEQWGGASGYRLFFQEQYKMDPCGAINELMKFKNHNYTRTGNQACPPEVQQAYYQLQMAVPTKGDLQGYVFAWAIFNFSRDPSLTVSQALEAPVSARASAEQSGARVAGEAPKLEAIEGTEYFFSSCSSCKSMIPAELQLQAGQEVLLTFAENEIDWQFQGDQATYSLQARLVFENGPYVRVFEKSFVIVSQKAYVVTEPVQRLAQRLLEDEEVAELPSGTYRVNVYVVNTLTNKYVAWERTFVKP